ncbi:MAG: Abi-alpha family protein [bacterium]|nr:Abi-alpha family protein [bacterium]
MHASGRWIDGKLGRVIDDLIGITIGDTLSTERRARQILHAERLQTLAHQAHERLVSRGVDRVQAPPDKILIPLLDAASLEDDPELQQLWAELLASALTHEEAVRRAYVSILSELTPTAAKALRAYFLKVEDARRPPDKAPGWSYVGPTLDGDLFGVDIARDLARLGLVEPALISFMVEQEPTSRDPHDTHSAEIVVPGDLYRVVLTDSGRAFCEAVGMSPPEEAQAANAKV